MGELRDGFISEQADISTNNIERDQIFQVVAPVVHCESFKSGDDEFYKLMICTALSVR